MPRKASLVNLLRQSAPLGAGASSMPPLAGRVSPSRARAIGLGPGDGVGPDGTAAGLASAQLARQWSGGARRPLAPPKEAVAPQQPQGATRTPRPAGSQDPPRPSVPTASSNASSSAKKASGGKPVRKENASSVEQWRVGLGAVLDAWTAGRKMSAGAACTAGGIDGCGGMSKVCRPWGQTQSAGATPWGYPMGYMGLPHGATSPTPPPITLVSLLPALPPYLMLRAF